MKNFRPLSVDPERLFFCADTQKSLAGSYDCQTPREESASSKELLLLILLTFY